VESSPDPVKRLIDRTLAIQAQGIDVDLETGITLLLSEIGQSDASLAASADSPISRPMLRTKIQGYLESLQKLPARMGLLFANVCALIGTTEPSGTGTSVFSTRQLDFLFQTAMVLYQAESLDATGKLLKIVFDHSPHFGPVHAALGMLAERMGHHEEVLTWYQSANALIPGHPKIPLLYAQKLFTMGRADTARLFLESEKSRLGDHDELWRQLGLIAFEQSRFDDAVSMFQRAIEIAPERSAHYQALASIHLRGGQFERAWKVVDAGIAHTTETVTLETLRISIDVQRGEPELAIEAAEALVRKHPEIVEFGITLAEQYIATAQFGRAAEQIRALNHRPDAPPTASCMIQAELALATYDLDAAAEHLRLATQQEPLNLDAQMGLLQAHLMSANVAAARTTMHQVDTLLKKEGRVNDRRRWQNSFFADLLQECRTNPHAESALNPILPLTSGAKLAALASHIQQDPGYLPFSIGLLNELRRSGVLAAEQANPSGPAIPKTFIQFWDKSEIPSDISNLMQSWRDCTDFEYLIFNDRTAEAFIAERCRPHILKAYRMANHPAMRSDLFRLAYLAVCGGIYADADDRCRIDPTPLMPSGFDLIVLQENLGSIGNNFIAAAPAHPWIGFALNALVAMVIEKQGDNIWFLTGPGALSSAFCQFYQTEFKEARLPLGVRVPTVYELNQYISPHIPCSHKQDERNWASQHVRQRSLFRRI
jgi:mannosyltransferase OCH1-like enzyme/predicted Zn-dependent protease